MLRFFCGFALIFFFIRPSWCQTPAIDSLRDELKREEDTRVKADLNNRISSELFDYDLALANHHAEAAYQLARSVSYLDGMRYALILRGFYFFGNGKYKEALRFHQAADGYSKNVDSLKAYNWVMMGNVYQATARYDSSEYYYREAIRIQETIRSEKYLAYAYKNLGKLKVLQWKNEEAEKIFTKALSLYEARGNQWGMSDTWFALAQVKLNLAQYNEAHAYVDTGCAVANELGDEFITLYCFVNQGEVHYQMGEYTESLTNLFEAVEQIKNLDMPSVQSRLYFDLGEVYEALSQNEVSLKYYLEALKIAEKLGIKYEIARIQSSISYIYKKLRNFGLAYEFVNSSLELRRDISDLNGISESLNRKGLILQEEGKYDSAMTAFSSALAIRRKIGNKAGISTCLFNQAKVLEDKKEYSEALRLFNEVLIVERQIQNPYNLGVAFNAIGGLYVRLKKFDSAFDYLTKAREIGAETGIKTIQMENNLHWSYFYEAKSQFSEALKFHKAYAALNDSIYFEIGAGKLAEMQALYQVDKKDQEIKLLSQQRQIQDSEISLQRSRINFQSIIIFSVVLGLLLVSLLALKTYQYNKTIRRAHNEIIEQKEEIETQSEEIKEANTLIAEINRQLESKIEQRTKALEKAYKELDTFFYRSSHDFRRPLTTFLGLAEVANVTVRDPNALELFEKVRETAVNLDKMLVKLQSISDVGSQELVFKEVLLKEIFDNICLGFKEELQRRGIRPHAEISIKGRFVSYPAMVRNIIENLVENAVQFCGAENCFIRMHASESENNVIISLQDNGTGIGREYHDQIFEMYFRASERSKGNGLGLYIVKKAVEKLDGSITLVSTPGQGSTFTVVLPNHG